jgi:hypothetical protein
LHLGLSEECSDNEGGCSREEVDEVLGSSGVVSIQWILGFYLKKVQTNTCACINYGKKSLNSDGHQFHQ